VLAGQYVSVFKGRGIEFDEVRPYLPGDDVRTIDWNVTARMGQPYVKRYIEERQLTLMLLADVSMSQDFGSTTRSKREAAAELCALLAFSATRNDDKVGLLLFHGGIEQYIPARKGQKHSLRVVREVLTHGAEPVTGNPSRGWRWWPRLRRTKNVLRTARQSTNIASAMEFLMSVMTRRAVCFVVSDFFDDKYLPAMRAANRKHDVIAILVTDPRELELTRSGIIRMEDPESGRGLMCDSASSVVRRTIASQARQRLKLLEQQFTAAKIDFIHVDVAGSVVDPLAKFFRMREGRRRR
jgi:uncharacterized protein (DUF58 family)